MDGELFLIKGSPTSSTSTLVLGNPGQDGHIWNSDDPNLQHLDPSAEPSFSGSSGPYMRTSRLSSPPGLASEPSGHEYPPGSSSPLLSSSSSTDDSPYFPVVMFSESDCSSGDLSTGADHSVQNTPDTGSAHGLYASPGIHYRLLLPTMFSKAEVAMDEFARSLHSRLLVVARERESEDNAPPVGDCSPGFMTCDLPLGVVSGDTGPSPRSVFDVDEGEILTDDSSDFDLDTPFFASPPLSEDITPPKLRKRLRKPSFDHGTRSNSTPPFRDYEDGKENRNGEKPQYRVIWRAESFQVIQATQLREEEWERYAPPLKRQKANTYSHRQEYASKPASLRRAASLKSDHECSLSAVLLGDQDWVPTEPATPIPSNHSSREGSFAKFGVPIIAPPLGHVASLPANTETLAKLRVRRFLDREFACRELDSDVPRQNADVVALKRQEPGHRAGALQRELWEELLTVGQVLREDAIDWLLSVLPPDRESCASSRTTSFSSATSSGSTSNPPMDLYDELSSSPETRFHAAYIFLRFFYCVMSGESDLEQVLLSDGTTHLTRVKETGDTRDKTNAKEEGRELMIWDMAVGSLALSVKFHRDVLEPLSPVFAWEYLELAPHRLSFEDLEAAQRDIFSALSYNLGVTPQLLLDDLWLALPSLRQLFEYEGGWNCVMKETWLNLFEAVVEPDVLRFPLTHISVACLVEGILVALANRRNYRLTWRKSIANAKKDVKECIKAKRQKRIAKKVGEEAEGVVHDIQALTGISDGQLQECRSWLGRMRECYRN